PPYFYRCLTRRSSDLPSDPLQNIRGHRGSDEFAMADDENILGAALRHVAVLGQDDSLVVAVIQSFALHQRRIDVGAAHFRAGGEDRKSTRLNSSHVKI